MLTKGQRKAQDRRRVRKAEKNSTIQKDKMIGKVAQRGYGDGRVTDEPKTEIVSECWEGCDDPQCPYIHYI